MLHHGGRVESKMSSKTSKHIHETMKHDCSVISAARMWLQLFLHFADVSNPLPLACALPPERLCSRSDRFLGGVRPATVDTCAKLQHVHRCPRKKAE